MPVTITLEEAKRRAVATVPEGVRWADFTQAIVTAIDRQPELASWDWIIDDQAPMDDVDIRGMTKVSAAYNRRQTAKNRSAVTVVVSTDPYFAPWAQVMDLHFHRRRHYSAPTLQAAHALLDDFGAKSPSVARP